MKRNSVSVFMIAGLLSVLLSGCQAKGESGGGTSEVASELVISMEEGHTEEGNDDKGGENTGTERCV